MDSDAFGIGSQHRSRILYVMEVLVQSYRIELVLAQVLDKDWKNTSMTLASPAEDGIYKGFMGVNGWETGGFAKPIM